MYLLYHRIVLGMYTFTNLLIKFLDQLNMFNDCVFTVYTCTGICLLVYILSYITHVRCNIHFGWSYHCSMLGGIFSQSLVSVT